MRRTKAKAKAKAKRKAPARRMSLRGYAAHRRAVGLRGTSKSAVEKAIASGRIEYDRDLGIDPELADLQWAKSTDPGADRGGGRPAENGNGNGTGNREAIARARMREADAELRELDLAKRRGSVVDLQEAEARSFDLARRTRDRILGVAEPVSLEVRTLRSAKKIAAVLTRELRRALEELAGE